MTKRIALIALALAVALAAGACGKLGPQKRQQPAEPAQNNKQLYEVDLTKPEGPMYQILRAAQERNYDLFKQSFAPSVAQTKFDEKAFTKFRQKVLMNKVTPVPESVEMVSDTQAIVKLRNSRGRELPIHVEKVDGKWYVSKAEFGQKRGEGFKKPA